MKEMTVKDYPRYANLLAVCKELASWTGPKYAANRALSGFQEAARAAIASAQKKPDDTLEGEQCPFCHIGVLRQIQTSYKLAARRYTLPLRLGISKKLLRRRKGKNERNDS